MPDKSRQPTPSRLKLNPVPTPSSPGTAPFQLRSVNLSDIGRARDHQEDASGIFKPSDPALLARRGELFIVADGMGGHNAGEVASQLALNELQRVYYADPSPDMQTGLAQALQAANQAIYGLSQADARQMGMGTTAVMVAVHNQAVVVANVGDSRAYWIRNGRIAQITQDHSWVEEQVRAGVLTPEQARIHPQRNVITRALGTGPTVQPDFYDGVLQTGDILVLCSDGLTGHVTDQEILLIAGDNPPQVAAQRLIELANERGGSDNISVIIVRAEAAGVAPAASAAAPARPAPTTKGRSPALLFGLIGAILLGVVVLVLLVIKPGGDGSATTPTATAVAATPTQAPAPSSTPAVAETSPVSETPTPPAPTASTGPATATLAPTNTVTPTRPPTHTPTRTPTATPPPTDTPVPPTDTPTVPPTVPPTDTPTVAPTVAPTDTPTVPPTDTPTVAPAGSPAP